MKFRALLSATVAVLVLTGCSGQSELAGSAAIVAGKQIPTTLVTARVNEVRMEIEQLPASQVSQVPTLAELSRMILSRAILEEVLALGLAQQNIVVTDAQVSEFKQSVFAQYGQDVIEAQIATQNGVGLEQVDNFMRMVFGEQLLAQLLTPNGTSDEQTNGLVDYLGTISRDMDIQTSPRFGEWNPNDLQVLAGDMALSQPAAIQATQ
ncbi:unannotated protein [freshwater metagenome]|uniref:Unannotated protein n=1 Tax=freshwater metagenome TaxID=449393 RepID=A0A6J5ZFH2_9ZZZZ